MYNKILPNTVWCYWAGNVLCAMPLQRVKLRKSLQVIHFWYMDTLSCLTRRTWLAYFQTALVFFVSCLLKWNKSLVRCLWFKLCELSTRGVFWSICGRLIIQSRLLGRLARKGVCYVTLISIVYFGLDALKNQTNCKYLCFFVVSMPQSNKGRWFKHLQNKQNKSCWSSWFRATKFN